MKISSRSALRFFIIAVGVIAVVLMVSVGISAVTTPGCTSCHKAEAKAVAAQTTGHQKVSCVQCHVRNDVMSRVVFGFDQVFGMTLRMKTFSDRGSSAVLDATCENCHTVKKEITSGKGLRIDHAACAVDSACTDCHAGVAHSATITWQRDPDMSLCLACHADKGASLECDVCHVSKTQELRLTEGSRGSLWILHDKKWQSTHAMGNMKVCVACHQENFCGRCHGAGLPHDSGFKINHGKTSLQVDAQCMSCHKKTYCDSCHGLEMPHPANFKPEHAAIVKKDGDTLCKTCHAESDCTTCHVLHVHPGGAVR